MARPKTDKNTDCANLTVRLKDEDLRILKWMAWTQDTKPGPLMRELLETWIRRELPEYRAKMKAAARKVRSDKLQVGPQEQERALIV